MRAYIIILIVAAMVARIALGATPNSWSDVLDIAVIVQESKVDRSSWDGGITVGLPGPIPLFRDFSNPPDVMICIVDADGAVQCSHRSGRLACSIDSDSNVRCPHRDGLLSNCHDAFECVFDKVSVPADLFGLLILDLDIHFHDFIDAVILARSLGQRSMPECVRIDKALRALALHLAPSLSLRVNNKAFPFQVRADCASDSPCVLRQSAVGLAAQ